MTKGIAYLIDDDPIYQFTFKAMFKLVGQDYELHSFSDGEQAYEHCQQICSKNGVFPDFIFLDLNMPVMDGWDFLNDFLLLKDARFSQTKVYIVSSSMYEEDIKRAKNYPIVKDYLIKPVGKEELLALLSDN